MKHKILIVLLFVGLTACMKVVKKAQENNVAPAANPAQSLGEKETRDRAELDYSFDVDSKSNVKKVRFMAATNWPASVVVKKKDGDKLSEFGAEFNERSEWSDLLISENKVNYQFFSKMTDQLILLEEVEVVPPLNLEVVDDINLAQKYALNEKTKLIYFESLSVGLQKRIYFENYSGKIKIQNLVSKSGFIQSYSANARAVNDFDGKDGGVLRIEIVSGSGDVTVFMKGENGGHGSPAKAPDAALKGATGSRGTPSQFEFELVSLGQMSHRCSTLPGVGGNGVKGFKGYPGNSGKSGGHSGRAIITNFSAELEVMMESQAGAAGVGSPGGTGGEGGDPGLGADGGDDDYQIFLRAKNMCVSPLNGKCYVNTISISSRCAAAGPGTKGEQGDPGQAAGNGVDGTKQKSCLFEAEQKIKCINE